MSVYPPIQSLWIGPRLSTLERLTIASFLANGHEFHLYTYDDVADVPAGTKLLDGASILPPSRIFRYTENGSLAGFANFFRYRLLLEKGGWWVDLDTVCLKPFDFDSEYVFSSEIHEGIELVNVGAIKAPAQSEVAKYAWEVCDSKDVTQLVWGETGPFLFAEAVERHGLSEHVRPPETFCPIHYPDWHAITDPAVQHEFGPEVYAVHLWNEMWRRNNHDKDALYPSECLFERLKVRYLGAPTSSLIPDTSSTHHAGTNTHTNGRPASLPGS